MDALSLVLPAATIANPGSNAPEGGLDARTDAAPADFATLLAAGLVPPQDPAQLLSVPQAAEPAIETQAALTDANRAGRIPMPSSLHAGVMDDAQLESDEGSAALATPLAAAPGTRAEVGTGGATFAAQAATIAGGAAADQALGAAANAETKAVDEALAFETQASAGADGATALGHPLHL